MKKFFTILAMLLLMLPIATPVVAAENTQSITQITANDITAKSAIAVDAKTGQVLYEKDARTVRPIASMSKILAAYLIMKSVKEGKMDWNQKISISSSLAKVSQNNELTNVPLVAGQSYTVNNLLNASLIYSANAAILALGKAQAGSSAKFVDEMRATVKSWGIKDAKLYNAAGLLENQVGDDKYPNSDGNAENAMSAKDMAIVVTHVLKEFPEILNITKIQETTFDTGSEKLAITNHNELLRGGAQYDDKYQIDGLKTGTSEKAGEDFSATGKIHGRRVISVVLGSKTNQRFRDTKEIWQTLTTKLKVTNTVLSKQITVNINSARDRAVQLKLSQPFGYWSGKNTKTELLVNAVKVKKNKIKAPLPKNKVIATAKIDSQQSYFLEKEEIPVELVTTKKVSKANFLVRIARDIADWFN